MLMYENFINDMFPRYKLAKAFTTFFNSINLSFECYYKRGKYGFIIKSSDNIMVNVGKKTKYNSPDGLGDDVEIINITIFPKAFMYDDNMQKFLMKVFNCKHMNFSIVSNNIDNYIEKLTKENYEDFLIYQNTKKYNL